VQRQHRILRHLFDELRALGPEGLVGHVGVLAQDVIVVAPQQQVERYGFLDVHGQGVLAVGQRDAVYSHAAGGTREVESVVRSFGHQRLGKTGREEEQAKQE
jgi:hypothetical protein